MRHTELVIVPLNKLLERWLRQVCGSATLSKSLPAGEQRSINTNEQKEGALQERLEERLVADITDHPSASPAFGHELKERVNRREGTGLSH